MYLARPQLQGDYTACPSVITDQQIQHVELVKKIDLVLDPLLIKGLEDHVPRAIGGITGPLDGPLAEVPGMTSEPALIHAAVREAIERETHMLQFEHGIDRLL